MTVVPTFAPRTIGKACSSVRRPAPAKGTSSDVVVELDSTIAVVAKPTPNPREELLPRAREIACSTEGPVQFRIKLTILSKAPNTSKTEKRISVKPC